MGKKSFEWPKKSARIVPKFFVFFANGAFSIYYKILSLIVNILKLLLRFPKKHIKNFTLTKTKFNRTKFEIKFKLR